MRIHTLTSIHSHPKANRVGRGISAGQGKTAGRGTKGQKSRTGANSNIPRTFEGAATSFVQRLPKLKGFKSHRIKPYTLNISKLAPCFEAKQTISFKDLFEKGLLPSIAMKTGVKIVGSSTGAHTFQFDTSDTRLTTSKRLQSK